MQARTVLHLMLECSRDRWLCIQVAGRELADTVQVRSTPYRPLISGHGGSQNWILIDACEFSQLWPWHSTWHLT